MHVIIIIKKTENEIRHLKTGSFGNGIVNISKIIKKNLNILKTKVSTYFSFIIDTA